MKSIQIEVPTTATYKATNMLVAKADEGWQFVICDPWDGTAWSRFTISKRQAGLLADILGDLA